MPKSLPTRALREQPDLEQLKRQAKELLNAFRANDPAAVTEVQTHYHGADPGTFALHDAQLALARAYGFGSWPKLKAYVDGVTVARLRDAVTAGDVKQVQAMLAVRPELARMDMSENDEHQALHYAVLARNAELVRLLIRTGANPRKGIYPHRDATTALTLAVERGYDDIAGVIREEEKQSGKTLHFDNSPPPIPPGMMEAARRGDQDAIIPVLEANPWMRTPHFQHPLMTPLHSAVAMLMDRVALWLLDHGADVNARVDDGPSPLEIVGCSVPSHIATQDRVAAVAAMLRNRGAEMTPRAAVAYGETEWLQMRHSEGKLAHGLPRNQGYRGLLEMAVTHGRPEILKLLLGFGLDPDEVLPMGDTGEFLRFGPLRKCLEINRIDMAETLLAHGATLIPRAAVALRKGDWLRAQHAAGKLENSIGDEGGLLSCAVRNNLPDMLALLLELGLDPDERVRVEGMEEVVFASGGALHHCASTGKLAMAEMLLARGADPNLHVYAAGPPMFKAYEAKDAAMVALLEKFGAVVDASTAGILRLVDKARALLDDDAAGRLKQGTHAPGCPLVEELLFYAADGGEPDIVRMALERIDWPSEDARWHSMLVRNLGNHEEPDRRRHVECFRLILDRCDPSIRGKFGRTILHDLAADWPHPSPGPEERVELANLVLDRNPRLDIRDHLLKSTPLGWACRWGRTELVQLLLDRGADPVEPTAESWATPRAWAEKRRHSAIVNLLGDRSQRSSV
jgi:ankyrin repeat protein